jgi:hypothetical protein
MYSDTGNTTSLVLGFPIRTPSDQRSVGSSPRHIAASHVLHRPLMPRHPPCALKHLQSTKPLNKEKSHHNKPPHTQNPTLTKRTRSITYASLMLATTIHESNTTPHHQAGQQHHHPKPIGPTPPHHPSTPNGAPKRQCTRVAGLLSQSPIVCPVISREPAFPYRHRTFAMCTRPPPTTGVRPSNESSRSPNSHRRGRA